MNVTQKAVNPGQKHMHLQVTAVIGFVAIETGTNVCFGGQKLKLTK
jgi:hypothetical protein